MASRSIDDVLASTTRCSTETSKVLVRCHVRQRALDDLVDSGRALISTSRRLTATDVISVGDDPHASDAEVLTFPAPPPRAAPAPVILGAVASVAVNAVVESAAVVERVRVARAGTKQQIATAAAAVAASKRLLRKP